MGKPSASRERERARLLTDAGIRRMSHVASPDTTKETVYKKTGYLSAEATGVTLPVALPEGWEIVLPFAPAWEIREAIRRNLGRVVPVPRKFGD